MDYPICILDIQKMFNLSLLRFREVLASEGEEDPSYGNLPQLFRCCFLSEKHSYQKRKKLWIITRCMS